MSDNSDISRVYIPKPTQPMYTDIIKAFRERGAAALPAEYRAHVSESFSSGSTIEGGMLGVMVRRLHAEMFPKDAGEPSSAGAADESGEGRP